MNWVDLSCIVLLVFGALSGLNRGFIREVVGLFGWVFAAGVSNQWYPSVMPKLQPYIPSETVATIISFAGIFLLVCILINALANLLFGTTARISILGRVDRILGALCGAVKCFAGLSVIYILGTSAFPSAEWPEVLQESQIVPPVYQGAVYINDLLPNSVKRNLPAPQIKTPRTIMPKETTPDTEKDPNQNTF